VPFLEPHGCNLAARQLHTPYTRRLRRIPGVANVGVFELVVHKGATNTSHERAGMGE